MFSLTALMGFLLLSGGALSLPAHAQAPSALSQPSYAVTLTAYNAVPEQTDEDPLITASGAFSNPEIVAARSKDLSNELPFGTIIEISGPSGPDNSCGYRIVKPIIGYRVIADTMNARYTNRIDILFHTNSNYTMADGKLKNAGAVLGICNDSNIKVVGLVHMNRIPKTQKELAAILAQH
ncbi:3D domain-containing protein [Candidatus Kaiserbacteria bacterium]|nr:3D domain-containing protein [Candidatus Kaiserbacteria bacterium]